MLEFIDITEICNYDGMCMLSDENSDKHMHGWCYGDKFGCEECPLKNKMAIVDFKKEDINVKNNNT